MSETGDLRIEVLHIDEEVVVVNKPGGLLVHRSRESADRRFLLQELGGQLGRILYPVHRLDRAASGAIAFAFSSDAARRLHANLAADDAIKEYIALVRGETPEAGESTRPLTDKSGVRKPARTTFERIALFSRCSLLRVRISTGRRHQIRRHLSHLRHQLIGDTSHGKGRINQFFRDNYGLPRLCLHAARIDIRHPSGEGRLDVRAPLSADLREFLRRLPDVDPLLVAEL
ncbi:MAG: pseudouridylate synthase [Planctomycetes bacterium]|nr:pseudouridylate synthase [Planctomycetota bacterium]